MNVLITGADGFIGRKLIERLLATDAETVLGKPVKTLTLLDQRFAAVATDSRVTQVEGDLGSEQTLLRACLARPDLVFHLASIPGGAATKNFELGLRVNLEATIALLEVLRQQGNKPRVVFASTIGVYGVPMPEVIDEDTLPEPSMSYGAHKWIGEILISDYSLRGFIDGRSLRLPGIVSRPPAPSGMLSAFLSDMIRELWAGRSFTCPVGAEGRAWWMSRPCVVDNILHAASLDPAVAAARRTWLLPVMHASMEEVVGAIARQRGDRVLGNVRYERNEALQAQFANLPPLRCPKSLAAGFRNDGTLESLVQRALEA
ncbi:NAD-dependent epimerase/dehydratase family protein [Steroidobacter sp.]|uniref:NAD-dependent epimerase/dehydratase family protein n=1 Tax=Steroidobacter sp. TaxID=1978227 RepID=UPI001A50F256|nr:NAD-dependent epimerase/dehydratase family protein [Steroidobacter sp.]MBL8266035.1 NAD-dependent epimerase/dehydratase family protein [Steroidobacter sp.]